MGACSISPRRNDGSMRNLHDGTSRDPRQKIISSLPSLARQISQTFSIEKSDGSVRGDIGPTLHDSSSVGSKPSTMKGQCDSDTENRRESDRGRKATTRCPNFIETWSNSRTRPEIPTPLGRMVTDGTQVHGDESWIGRKTSPQRASDRSNLPSPPIKLPERESDKAVPQRSREPHDPTSSDHGRRNPENARAWARRVGSWRGISTSRDCIDRAFDDSVDQNAPVCSNGNDVTFAQPARERLQQDAFAWPDCRQHTRPAAANPHSATGTQDLRYELAMALPRQATHMTC